MLPADVGAAPAAASRYQRTASTPASTAGRERPASGADPFGDLVDQYAGDAEPGATGARRAGRQAPRQAMSQQPQRQPLLADAPVATVTAPAAKAPSRPSDGLPATIAAPAENDEVRADLAVPSMPVPPNTPRADLEDAGGADAGAVAAAGRRQGANAEVAPGTPLRPDTWPQSIGETPAEPGTDVDAVPVVDTGSQPTAAEHSSASAGLPLDELTRTGGLPPEAASPDVQAALRAARTANPSGATGLGAAVSAAASGRSGQATHVAGPAAPADPRAVALAAVREALSQPVHDPVDDTGPAATAATASMPDADAAPPSSPVSQPAVATANRLASPAVAPRDGSGVVTTAPDAQTAAVRPQDPDGVIAPAGSADQGRSDAVSARSPRQAKQASGQTPTSDSTAPLNEAVSLDDAAQATPARKASHDDAPVQPARPTARAAQAIAAFQAAAAIGATSTPAAVHAAAVGAAVSSTPLLDSELPTQLIHAIRVQFDQGSGEARIRLNPGFLGGVTVGVQIDGSSVTASLQAANADVREWMRTNESVLRQALADQGLQLDRLVIVDEDAPASRDEQDTRPREDREQQAPRRQRRTADQGTFELVF